MDVVVESGHRRRRDALEDSVLHLQHRDREPGLGRDRCDLQADVAATHDDDAPGRPEILLDRVHVGDGAQVVNTRKVASRCREFARSGTCREQQLVVADLGTIATGDALAIGIDSLDAHAATDVDVSALVEPRGPKVHPAEIVLAGEVLLRQRRTLIGDVRLFADYQDLALVVLLTQARRSLSGGVAAADDDDGHWLLDRSGGVRESL